MARTTPFGVVGIIDVDATIDLTPFIDIANELVTELCTGDLGPDPGYSTVRLELIERWLAAHFYTNRDPRPVNEKAGPVGEAFQSEVDLGFDTSHYGQTAIRLDTNGELAKLNRKTKKLEKAGTTQRASLLWIGTEVSEVIGVD